MNWTRDANNIPQPVYTVPQLERIARACWDAQGALKDYRDRTPEDAAAVRELMRALNPVRE